MSRKGDGTDDSIIVAAPGPANYTLAFWIRTDHTPTTGFEQPSSWMGVSGSSEGISFSWDHNSSSFRQAWAHFDTDYRPLKYTTSLLADTWYHMAVTYDGTTLTIYLNGVSEGTPLTPAAIDYGTGVDNISALALADAQSYSVSEMAEYGAWSAALGPNEIAALAQGSAPYKVRKANSVLDWPMWGIHSPEIDRSGNGRSGTLASAPTRTNHPPVQLATPKWAASNPLVEVAVGGGGIAVLRRRYEGY